MADLVPGSFWRFPTLRGFWDDDDDFGLSMATPSGISISEDDTHVYVDVATPGVDPKDVEITFDKGVLWVKAEKKEKEEDKKRKFYRQATRSFSYRVAVPGDIDLSQEPQAQAKNGMMHISFTKSKHAQPKKITVKI